MKAFLVFTALRILLFVVCYAVFAGIWKLAQGGNGLYIIPFVAAAIVSALLSLRFLRPQREAFARHVEARAARASGKLEEMRSREDV